MKIIFSLIILRKVSGYQGIRVSGSINRFYAKSAKVIGEDFEKEKVPPGCP